MRSLIHIGQHKTGTTSIQSYLKNNRHELAAQGLYVPDSLIGFENSSHFILNVYSLAENRFSSMKERLLAARGPGFFGELRQNLETDIARHYQQAAAQGCKDIIWTNEGLFLLNSVEEYRRLYHLFDRFSSAVVCVCCFRDVPSFRASYIEQHRKTGLLPSDDRDSCRYLEPDSWLFDYERKKQLLGQIFTDTIYFPYSKEDMIKKFMGQLGYEVSGTDSVRLNVTKAV
jgi:hypothetical protein